MKEYVVKYDEIEKIEIINTIESLGGEIVYFSPLLPILGTKLTEDIKTLLESSFNLSYIMEEPVGRIQEIKGTLHEAPRNTVQLFPGLETRQMRNLNYVGWGSTVAVLDTGVEAPLVTEQYDYTGFGNVPFLDHGTKVATIIKQFAPGANIISYKVCETEEVGMLKVLAAIDEAIKKADIINLSLGFNVNCSISLPCPLCEHVNAYTQHLGKLFVVAAGNRGMENSIDCPGNAQESITVGAVHTDNQTLAPYSSRGVPGIKKPNLITTGSIYYTPNTHEGVVNGTSFSTPIVTGVCATIFPKLNKNINKTKAYLFNTANDLCLPEHHQGFGLLDIEKLLEELENDQGNSKSKGQILN